MLSQHKANTGEDTTPELYRALNAIMTLQLRSTITQSVDAFVAAVAAAPASTLHLHLGLELHDDNVMVFDPPRDQFLARITDALTMLCSALANVPPLDVWIMGGLGFLHTAAEAGFVESRRATLLQLVDKYLAAPAARLLSYDRYATLLPGAAAEQEVAAFLTAQHSFEDYGALVQRYDALADELLGLDSLYISDFVDLTCDKLNMALLDRARALRNSIVERMLSDYRSFNHGYKIDVGVGV